MIPAKPVVEPITNAVHLCIDMQNIFARGSIWETPWMERVLPAIVDIVGRCPARTVFTRFITPRTPSEERSDEMNRQKKIRRGLRGLSAEHDPTRHGP